MTLAILIEKLLTEVDADIKEVMLAPAPGGNKVWEWLPNPTMTILEWQQLRDRQDFKKKYS